MTRIPSVIPAQEFVNLSRKGQFVVPIQA